MRISQGSLAVVLAAALSFESGSYCDAFVHSRKNNDSSGRLRSPRQRRVELTMVLDTPPELADYMKTKLGTASSIDPDHVMEEVRKQRQVIEAKNAKHEEEEEEDKKSKSESTMSPEVAEYLQTKLGMTASKPPMIQNQVDRLESQTVMNEQLLREATVKAELLAKKAEELTQRVNEMKQSSLKNKAPQDSLPPDTEESHHVTLSTTESEDDSPLESYMTLAAAAAAAVSNTQPSQLALAREAKKRSQTEMELRDEALRNQAESRRLAWEESKKRAEEKAKNKRKQEKIEQGTEQKQQNKFDLVARFEAWKEARVQSEESNKQQNKVMPEQKSAAILAHSEAESKWIPQEQVQSVVVTETQPELDEETKLRYEAWKQSKLEKANENKVNTNRVAFPTSMVSSSDTTATTSPRVDTRARSGPAASSSSSSSSSTSVPPASPRFDPRNRPGPEGAPTIVVKAVRNNDPSSPSSSPNMPIETVNIPLEGPSFTGREYFDLPDDRPFFLERPDDLYFLEVGEAAQVRLAVETQLNYQPPLVEPSYNNGDRMRDTRGPSQTTSGSWLGNLWRQVNRPNVARPSEFEVRTTATGTSRSDTVGQSFSVRRPTTPPPPFQNTRFEAPTKSTLPPEFAVRPTRRPSPIVVPKNTKSGTRTANPSPTNRNTTMRPTIPLPRKTIPISKGTSSNTATRTSSAESTPPEFAVRPIRPSATRMEGPKQSTGSATPRSTSTSSRKESPNTTRSSPPEFTVRSARNDGVEKPKTKPPYYAKW